MELLLLTWILKWYCEIYITKFFNEDSPRMIKKETTTRNSKQNVSVYTHSVTLVFSSNLTGSLSLANKHYSLPTRWIKCDPNKNKVVENPKHTRRCCT